MELENIKSLPELERTLLDELKNRNFQGIDYSIYEVFSKEDNAIISELTKEFNRSVGFVESMGSKVVEWFKEEHEVPERSIPYWVFMDYLAIKAAVNPNMTLFKYTTEYLLEKYNYTIDFQMY